MIEVDWTEFIWALIYIDNYNRFFYSTHFITVHFRPVIKPFFLHFEFSLLPTTTLPHTPLVELL